MNAGARRSPSPSTTRWPFMSSPAPSCEIVPPSTRTSITLVHSLGRVEDARAADDDVVVTAARPTRTQRSCHAHGRLDGDRPGGEQVVRGPPSARRAQRAPGRRRVPRPSRRRAGRSRRRGSSAPGASPSAPAQPVRRDAPAGGVLAQRGNVVGALVHPFALHPEDVDDVGVADRRDVVGDLAQLRAGRSGGGPTSVTRAPTRCSAWISERATREWSTSPTIATWRPSRRPSSTCIEYRSRRACVGCWCFPSPAFTTCASVRSRRAEVRRCADAAHDHVRARTRRESARCPSVTRPPLDREPVDFTDSVSAERRFAASSNDDKVRVEDS